MAERTPQNQDKYVLRLPDGMRDRIKAAAEANNRSMNAEIVWALGAVYGSEVVRMRDGKVIEEGDITKDLRGLTEAIREWMAEFKERK